jgi:hypothetical protein
MERKIAGVLGAVATLGAINAAQAAPMPTHAPSDSLRATSFAELLEPIPNATERLQALDENQPNPRSGNDQLAQYCNHHPYRFYRH